MQSHVSVPAGGEVSRGNPITTSQRIPPGGKCQEVTQLPQEDPDIDISHTQLPQEDPDIDISHTLAVGSTIVL